MNGVQGLGYRDVGLSFSLSIYLSLYPPPTPPLQSSPVTSCITLLRSIHALKGGQTPGYMVFAPFYLFFSSLLSLSHCINRW